MEKENWEKEFDSLLCSQCGLDEPHEIIKCHAEGYGHIKSFIRKLIETARTEGQINAGFDAAKDFIPKSKVKRVVEEMKKEVIGNPTWTQTPMDAAHNAALSDLQSKLLEE